jgi:hypothetical protein
MWKEETKDVLSSPPPINRSHFHHCKNKSVKQKVKYKRSSSFLPILYYCACEELERANF